MKDKPPPTIDNWDYLPDRADQPNDFAFYKHEDRCATVVVKEVSVSQYENEVLLCKLFVSEEPYTRGNLETTEIAETVHQLPETIKELYQ